MPPSTTTTMDDLSALQSHFAPRDFSYNGQRCRAHWSIKPRGTAILFVHGFWGSAETTWIEFPTLLPLASACGGCDLLFYEYESLRTQVGANGALLYDFLDELYGNPVPLVNGTLDPAAHRPASFRYAKVLIVAHSMGAVITRLALLSAHHARRPWLGATPFVLFAPAHMGARAARMAMDALMGIPWAGAVAAPFTYLFPSLDDLKPGSVVLQQLQNGTQLAIQSGAVALRPAAVVHGKRDKVVHVVAFGDDPPFTVVPDRGHVDLCKPNGQFPQPLQLVVAHL